MSINKKSKQHKDMIAALGKSVTILKVKRYDVGLSVEAKGINPEDIPKIIDTLRSIENELKAAKNG